MKKLMCLLSVCLLVMSMSGCRNADEGPPESPPASGQDPAPPAPSPSPTEPDLIVIKGNEYGADAKYVYLSDQGLTAADLEPLTRMTELIYLSLHDNNISDISVLKELATLERLDIQNNPVSREQYEELAAALPDCWISFGPLPDTESLIQPFTDGNGFVWAVAPRYDYEYINYCSCGRYTLDRTYVLSARTGEMTDVTDDSHDDSPTVWVADPARDLFGYCVFDLGSVVFRVYPSGEFAERFPDKTRSFLPVRQVDSSKLFLLEGDADYNDDLVETYAEVYNNYTCAIAYGSTMITDFVYDVADIDAWPRYHRTWNTMPSDIQDYIAVCCDGLWGMLDSAGQTVVPFVFEHIVSIDGQTAFAKYDGLYGVLDIPETVGMLS